MMNSYAVHERVPVRIALLWKNAALLSSHNNTGQSLVLDRNSGTHRIDVVHQPYIHSLLVGCA